MGRGDSCEETAVTRGRKGLVGTDSVTTAVAKVEQKSETGPTAPYPTSYLHNSDGGYEGIILDGHHATSLDDDGVPFQNVTELATECEGFCTFDAYGNQWKAESNVVHIEKGCWDSLSAADQLALRTMRCKDGGRMRRIYVEDMSAWPTD